jgi:hypothetical protein
VDPECLERPKIRTILRSRPALASRLSEARQEIGDRVTFDVEGDWVRRIIVKLARGHVLFDLNEPRYEEPSSVALAPISSMSADKRTQFETPPPLDILPEVGSRAMQRVLLSAGAVQVDWVDVQEGRYRYLTLAVGEVVVRMVLSEYLACEVIWER